jgi:hypothetical protein
MMGGIAAQMTSSGPAAGKWSVNSGGSIGRFSSGQPSAQHPVRTVKVS